MRYGGTTQSVRFSPKSLTCINALPAVTLTAPANNAVFTAPATITLAASANDPDGFIAKVDSFDGATLVWGTASAVPYRS